MAASLTQISCLTMRVISPLSLLLSITCLCFGQSAIDEGVAAFSQGRYSVALAKLKSAGDEKGRAFYHLAEAATGNCKLALPELKKNAYKDPTLYRLTHLAALKCASSSGDETTALDLLQSLQARFPNDPDVLYAAAKLHMAAFNDATLAMFQRTPSSYRVHELSAEIFEVDHRFSEAIEEYRKAIALNPGAPDLHFRLGRAILLQSHDAKALDQAQTEFESELKLSPEDSASEFQLGQIATVRGNPAAARTNFERAVALSPGFVQALIALAKIDLHDKNYEGAIGLLTRATNAQPANEPAHYTLMTAYRDAGRMDQAKAEKAILDTLQKPPEGEFSNFLKKLGEKPAGQ